MSAMTDAIWPHKSDDKETGESDTVGWTGEDGGVSGGQARIHATIPWRSTKAKPQPASASPSSA